MFFAAVLTTAAPSLARAADFYVATNGNDSNPGTLATPFKTLERGVRDLRPGDTLYVRGGTYKRTTDLWDPPSGTSWDKAVTITNYQNEQVIVNPNKDIVFNFKDTNIQYVIMNGLIIDALGRSTAVNTRENNHHIRFSNGEMRNTQNSAMQTSKASHLQIVNMKIHDSGDYGIYHNGHFGLFEGNDFYDIPGAGVHLWSSTAAVNDNLFINNRFYNTGYLKVNPRGGSWSRSALVFGAEGGAARNIAINNIFWGNGRGIQLMGSATDSKIYNNTFYGNDATGILVQNPKNDVRNNLSFNNGEGDSIIAGTTQSNNLLGVDPKFKNSAGGDFHLTAASTEAIDKGVTLSEFNFDHEYGRRPFGSAYDIGAYEYGSTPGEVAPPGWTGAASGGSATGGELNLKDLNCIPKGQPKAMGITLPPGTTGTVLIAGLRPGFSLSAGQPMAGTNGAVWEVPVSQIPGLTMIPPAGFDERLELSITVIPDMVP